LWVFDNRMLRKVFGPKTVLVTGEWINSKMMSVNIIRAIK